MKKYLLLFLFLILLVFYLGVEKQFSGINVVFIAVCLFAYLRFPLFNVFLFVVMLSTNGLISTDYNLFGIFNVGRIVNIFAIISLLKIEIPWNYRTNYFQKLAIYFVILIFFIILFRTIKEIEFHLSHEKVTYAELYKRLAKYSLTSLALILLIRRYAYLEIRDAIVLGLSVSIIFLSASIWLSYPLNDLGFATRAGGLTSENVIMQERSSGFFMTEGDVNTAGGYFALVAGLLLSLRKIKKLPINVLLVLIFAIIGVVGTLSRAASIAMAGVLLIFVLHERLLNLRNIGIILSLAILLFIAYYVGYFDTLIERFSVVKETLSKDEDTRLGGWILYLNYIFSDIKIVLIGATENIYTITALKSSGYFRVAHNIFISNWYFFGISGFAILVYFLLQYYRKARKVIKENLTVWYTLFPLLMITFTTSDVGIFFPFVLAIPFAPYLNRAIYVPR